MFEKIYMYISARPKKILFLVLLLIGLLVAGGWLRHYLNTGSLIVKTNDNSSSIEITGVGTSQVVSQSKGELQTNLPIGKYTATVSSRSSTSKRMVEVKPHSSSTYTLDLQKSISPDYVLPFGASSLVAGKSIMFYVNISNQLLYKVDGSGVPSIVDQTDAFDSIQWQNEHYGVGLSQDDKTLYTINDGVVSAISLPFSSKRLYYDLSPSGLLVVSDGNAIYTKSAGGQFNKLSDPSSRVTSLSVGDGGVLVGLGSNSDGEDKQISKYIMVDFSGKTKASASFLGNNYKWSPNGRMVAVTTDGNAVIYDANLKEVAQIANNGSSTIVWQDNNNLLYGLNGQLYNYSIKDAVSTQLSMVPVGSSISGVYPSLDGSSVYLLTTQNDNANSSSTMRVGITAITKNTPSYYQTLGIFFPSYTDQCSFSYTNFLRPVILITAWTDTNTCINSAKAELAADELPVDAFGIVFQPAEDE